MKPSVLIVDDEPTIQRMYTTAFQNEGFEVRILADGVGVLGATLEQKPSLIMLDIMMPIKNGIDTLKEIGTNDNTKDIPILVLSAYEDDNLLTQAMELGAKRYLVKSMLEPTEVVTIAKQVLEESKTSQEN